MTTTDPIEIPAPADLTLTRGDLDALRKLLMEQRTRRLDIVTGPAPLRYEGGLLRIETNEQAISDEGVTSIDGWYYPTRMFDTLLGYRLGIPAHLVQKLRAQGRIELVDDVTNHYLHGSRDDPQTNPPFGGRFMVRLFTGTETGGGVARAVLSTSYKPVDNLEVAAAAVQGMEAAGLGPEAITRCDLTENRMYIQVAAPEVKALAPVLLKGYRSPFTGRSAGRNPVVFAGFVVTNREDGQGAARVVPRITVLACSNGMTFSKDAMKAIHLGVKHSDGIVQYGEDTIAKELEVVQLRVRDAVKTFLDVDYVTAKLRELEEAAGVEVKHPDATIKQVMSTTGVPATMYDEILDRFIKGGQVTAGGVLQAITATAQTLDDPDLMYRLEDKALAVVGAAARFAEVKSAKLRAVEEPEPEGESTEEE